MCTYVVRLCAQVHEEYLQASLTSAEALLGVINQVLEYAKLETQEDDNSLNKVRCACNNKQKTKNRGQKNERAITPLCVRVHECTSVGM